MGDVRSIRTKLASIANAATTSDIIEKVDTNEVGFAIPAAFTGVTIKFQVAESLTGTFQDLYDETYPTPVITTMTVAPSRSYKAPKALGPWPFFKLVSGSAEGAARTIQVVLSS